MCLCMLYMYQFMYLSMNDVISLYIIVICLVFIYTHVTYIHTCIYIPLHNIIIHQSCAGYDYTYIHLFNVYSYM